MNGPPSVLVYEIDTAPREVLRTLDTESSWSKVVEVGADGTKIYVANWVGDDVSEIDLSTGECTRRFRTGDTPRGLYATEDGAYLYVATYDDGELQRIDLATGKVVTLFDNNGALRYIVADAERGQLYISDMRNDAVFVHDMASGETREFAATDEKMR
ncbi:MAG TPA: hypothetical protein VFD74_06510 [Thermoleophilia bacterium]|nr:hypothetical protein [Thermoleophilia bacterium]